MISYAKLNITYQEQGREFAQRSCTNLPHWRGGPTNVDKRKSTLTLSIWMRFFYTLIKVI